MESFPFLQHTDALLWGELVEGFLPKAPDLEQKNPKAPHITGTGKLSVFNSLNGQCQSHFQIFKLHTLYTLHTMCYAHGIHHMMPSSNSLTSMEVHRMGICPPLDLYKSSSIRSRDIPKSPIYTSHTECNESTAHVPNTVP